MNLVLAAGDAWAMQSVDNFQTAVRRYCRRSVPGVTDDEIGQVLRMPVFEALQIPRKEQP
jgi:hypothetical protein